MSTDKKKGDFDQWQREDEGGNKKSGAKSDSGSRTADKENAGTAATSRPPSAPHPLAPVKDRL